jgi:hypothetical protein
MSEYVSYSGGPGSIAALEPLAALSHAPTISSNDPRGAMAVANDRIIGVDIKVQAGATKGLADPEQALIKMTHGAQPIPRLGACGCAMGDGEELSPIQRLDAIVLLGAMVAGGLYIAYRVMQEKQQEQEVKDWAEERRGRYRVQKGSVRQGPYR